MSFLKEQLKTKIKCTAALLHYHCKRSYFPFSRENPVTLSTDPPKNWLKKNL